MSVSVDADLAMHLSIELQKLTGQITAALQQGESGENLKQAQSLLLVKLVQLRAANRIAWQSSRAAKANTAEAKGKIDLQNLELQGLYYEQRHLQNEIKSCQDTPTIYQEIELIPEEEFLALKPESKELSARDLMHARLEHEKEERLRLAAVRKELMAKKAALIAENKRRKNDLESLEAQLQNFVGTAEKIESIFKKY